MSKRVAWIKNTNGEKPLVFSEKVQAGSTATINQGEICVFNETTGYFTAVNEVDDAVTYKIAVAHDNQYSDGLERYMQFIAMRPEDVFEFELAAARAVAIGDRFTLTASNANAITYTAAGFPAFIAVESGNYPEAGTTIGTLAYAQVKCNPDVSYYSKLTEGVSPVLVVTDDITLQHEQSGMTFIVETDAKTVTLPATKLGTEFTFVNGGASNTVLITVSPNASDNIAFLTATDDKDLLNTKASAEMGDNVTIVGDGDDGWKVKSIYGTWAKE